MEQIERQILAGLLSATLTPTAVFRHNLLFIMDFHYHDQIPLQ